MAYHSHERGNKGYGGQDRARGDAARSQALTFEQEAENRRKVAEAAALLGVGAEEAQEAPAGPLEGPQDAPGGELVSTPAPAPEKGRKRAGGPTPKGVPGAEVLPGIRITEATLADLHQDPDNARRHTPRNIGVIADSLQKVGAARSVAIDDDNKLMAGNGTHEAAAEVGINRVVIVDAPGDALVAVRRTGLTEAQKKYLAIADNRATDLSEFDPAALCDLDMDAPDALHGLFTGDEMEAFAAAAQFEAEREGDDEDGPLFPEDGPAAPEKPARRARRLAFRLDFDNAEQKRQWEQFRKFCKRQYGEDDSEAARMIAFLTERCPEVFDIEEPERDREDDREIMGV